jgi:hypothetical protein
VDIYISIVKHRDNFLFTFVIITWNMCCFTVGLGTGGHFLPRNRYLVVSLTKRAILASLSPTLIAALCIIVLSITELSHVGFEVFTAVTMKNAVNWDVASCRSCERNRLQLPAHADSSLADFSTLNMEAICSSETSVHFTGSARRHTPEDDILQNCPIWDYFYNLYSRSVP